jgi:hypothetical protein
MADQAQPDVVAEEAESKNDVDMNFFAIGNYFLGAIESLRDVHGGLAAAAENLDDLDSLLTAPGKIFRENATDKERQAVKAIFERVVPEGGVDRGTFIREVFEATKDTSWGVEFVSGMAEMALRRRRAPLFHGAMLTSFVSSLEAHFAHLATEYFEAAPEALHDLPKESLKEFSLRDIQAMSSIENAVENAIESRVSDLTFGNLAGWRSFFKDRMKVDLAELSVPWKLVQEIFERRNCVVHHDGRASKRYIAATGSSLQIGDVLTVTDDYAQRAVSAIELLGIQLHVAVWRKFSKNLPALTTWLEGASFSALKKEQWSTSLGLYETWGSLPLSQNEQLMARVNLFLAKKGIDGIESVRSEIVEWDVSGLDEIYTFAKACLVDDLDKAFEMIPVLIEREKLGGWALATWPLTKALRADSRISDYDEEMKEYLSEAVEKSGSRDDDSNLPGADEASDGEGEVG